MVDNQLFNTENEIAFLSILINNPERIQSTTLVKSFMLGSTPNQLLFDTIRELGEKGLVPDVGLIVNTVGTQGRLTLIGGQEYVEYLKNQKYEVDNFPQYEKLIFDTFKAKRLVELGASLSAIAKTTPENVDQIIEQTKASLNNLEMSVGGEVTSNFQEVLKEGWDALAYRMAHPGTTGIATMIADVDKATGGRTRGNLWIEAGRPSMGKTAGLCFSAIESAKAHGTKTLIFSYEMSKIAMSERFLGIESGIAIPDIHLGNLTQANVDMLGLAIARIKELPIYVDTNYSGGLPYVVGTIRRYHKLFGIDQVFIDYIQLMAERTLNATNELGQISREFKLLANELGIAITIASQLHRGVESRDDKHPMLSDLRQSGNLEEDADVVIMYYRDEYYNPQSPLKGTLEHMIRKNRQTGIIGSIFTNFDTTTGRISAR